MASQAWKVIGTIPKSSVLGLNHKRAYQWKRLLAGVHVQSCKVSQAEGSYANWLGDALFVRRLALHLDCRKPYSDVLSRTSYYAYGPGKEYIRGKSNPRPIAPLVATMCADLVGSARGGLERRDNACLYAAPTPPAAHARKQCQCAWVGCPSSVAAAVLRALVWRAIRRDIDRTKAVDWREVQHARSTVVQDT